jgi:O-antigen/teichoic acid export membrane protein
MARFTGGAITVKQLRDLLLSVEVLNLVITLIILIAAALFSRIIATKWLTAKNLSTEAVVQALAIMSMAAVFKFSENIYRSSLIGLQRQVQLNITNATLATIRSAGALGILAWVSPTVKAFFLWQGFVSLASVGVLRALTYRIIPRISSRSRFSLEALRGVWRFAGGMMGGAFLSLILMQVDKILLSELLSLSEYGYYTLAAAFAGTLYMLITPIIQTFYPRLCELVARKQGSQVVSAYHDAAQLATVIVGSAAILLIFYAEPLLRLWTKDAELAIRVAPLARLLALGNMLNCLMWVPYVTQVAYGWTSLAIRINSVAVLIIVPAIVWSVPRFGPDAAAWVWVMLNAAYLLVGVNMMYRRILVAERGIWYTQDVIYPLAAGLLTCGFVVNFWPTNWRGMMSDIVLLAVAGGAVGLTSLLAASRVRQQCLKLARARWLKLKTIYVK